MLAESDNLATLENAIWKKQEMYWNLLLLAAFKNFQFLAFVCMEEYLYVGGENSQKFVKLLPEHRQHSFNNSTLSRGTK